LLEIKLTEKTDLQGKTFVAGFHGIGFVGYITIKHLIKQLQAKRIGFIITDSMPPIVSMENERMRLPFELYLHNDIILLYTESLPSTKELHRFSIGIAEWVVKANFDKGVLIGGLDSAYLEERNSQNAAFRTVYTHSYRKTSDSNVPLLENGLFVVGPLALFMLQFEITDFPAIAVLPYASRDRVDPRAASVAINFINQELGLNVSVDELVSDAQKIEAETLRHAQAQMNTLNESTQYIK
jgi:uncharacterized protein